MSNWWDSDEAVATAPPPSGKSDNWWSADEVVPASAEEQQALKVEQMVKRANVPQTPEWRAARMNEAVLADADPLAKAPAIISEPYRAAASATAGIMGTIARPFSKNAADYMAKTKEDIGRTGEAARADDWSPWLSRMYGGASESLVQSAVASPLGATGIIGSFALTEGNQALYDAEQAGLKGADRIKYAVIQGAIEGGVAGAFQLAGLGGQEKAIADAVRGALKTSGKQFLKMTAQELPEEMLTELGHAVTEAVSGVSPDAMNSENFWPRMRDTVAQTMLTLGLTQGAARLTQNRQELQKLEGIRSTEAWQLKRRAAELGITGSRSEIKKQVEERVGQLQESSKQIEEAVQPQPEISNEVQVQDEVRQEPGKRTFEQAGQGEGKDIPPEVPVAPREDARSAANDLADLARRKGLVQPEADSAEVSPATAPETAFTPTPESQRAFDRLREQSPDTDPPIPEGMTRLYHGSGTPGRVTGDAWYSTNREYAQGYRKGAELQYVDVPTDWAIRNLDPDGYGVPASTLEIKNDEFGPRRLLQTPREKAQKKQMGRKQEPVQLPQPTEAAPSVGDNIRVMGVDSTLADVQEVNGVRYELYNDANMKGKGGAVRVFDADSGNVVSVVRYPSYSAAEKAHSDAISAVKEPESPQTAPEPESAPKPVPAAPALPEATGKPASTEQTSGETDIYRNRGRKSLRTNETSPGETDTVSESRPPQGSGEDSEAESVPTKKRESPAFRDWRFVAGSARNSGKIVPNRVGRKFTDEQVQSLVSWAKSQGMEVVGASPTGFKVVGSPGERLDLSLHGAVGVKREAAEAKAQASKQETERKRESREQQAVGRQSATWIADTFGDAMNAYNRNALSDFVEGVTPKFQGMVSPQWQEGLEKIGVNPGNIDWKKVKAAYETSTVVPKTQKQQAADAALADAHAEAEKLAKRIRSKGLPSNPMLDPEIVAGAARVVYKYAKANFLQFAAFTERLAKDIGQAMVDALRPVLESEWNKLHATGEFAGMTDADGNSPVPPKKTTAPKEPSSDTTGTKNVKTDELREQIGMGERPPVDPQSVEEWQSKAAKRMSDDPQYAGQLAEELSANPRALDAVEEAVLQRHLRELTNRYESGEDVLGELRTAVEADERVGTIWGRAGVSRQVELTADFSVAGIIRQHMRSVNAVPTDEQMEKYSEMADRIADLEGQVREKEQQLAQAEIDKQIAEAKAASGAKQSPEKRGTRKKTLQKNLDDAWSSFKKEWATLGQMGIVSDPKQEADKWIAVTKAAGSIVKAYAELKVESFIELLARIKKDFGEITSQQKKAFREAWDAHTASTKSDVPEQADRAGIGYLARKLTRFAVESGITDREEVVDAVHESLTGMGFKIGRSDTMAAISGYGDFRELSKDEVSVKVRGIKGELQQILKLEDMQAGQAPKKTGVERRSPTDEERRLIKLVNEGKKRGGYAVTDPARQLASALGAAKTSIRHRIADLENAIAKRERIVSGETKLKPDAELIALQKQRDELNDAYREIFPPKKSGMSDASRLAAAEKLLDRQISELQADLKNRQFDTKEKRSSLTSPEIDAKRKQLAALRESFNAAKKAAAEAGVAEWESEGGAVASEKGKKPLTDAQRLKSRMSSLERQIEDLQADLAAGKLEGRAKNTPLSSPEIESKRLQLEQLKAVREKARAASPEYQARKAAKENARYKASLQKQLEMWESRRAEAASGKLPEKRKSPPVDKEILETKYQIDQVKRNAQAEIEEAERAARGKVGKALGIGGDLQDLSQAIMTGYEMSAVLRQGAFYTFGFPKQALPALKDSMRSFFSRRADFAIHDDLMKRANHVDYMQGGLETTAADGPLSHREELIRSRIASWLATKQGAAWALPRWAAEGLLGSERAFRTFANTMRADLFDYMKSSVEASRPGTWSEDDAKVVGSASNVFSGRGELPGAMTGVSSARIFFAPRWVWSRGQLLVGQPLWKGNKATRLAVGKVYVRAALGMAAFQLVKHFLYAGLTDDDDDKPRYEFDPRSSDFGKTRIGDTRIDSGAGLNQLIVLIARVWKGETKTASGKIVPIRGDDVPYGVDDTRDVLHRFLDSKLAPLPSAVMDFITGENVVGEKATAASIAGERVTPMTWRDIWDAEKALNVPQGTVAAIEAFFGEGVTTYGQKTKFREADASGREEIISKDLKHLTWDAPDKPPYAEFLTDNQLKQFLDRRDERRQAVIIGATADPKRSTHKSDETFAESVAERDKHIESLREMKASGITYEQAHQMLRDYYMQQTDSEKRQRLKGSITPAEQEGYEAKRSKLRKLYGR